MKNTFENKRKFFAQYLGLNISCIRIEDAEDKKGFEVNLCDWKVTHEDAYLELKPLSQISDEDAYALASILEISNSLILTAKVIEVKSWLRDEFGFGKISHKWEAMEVQDYLRSKGYALPWMGIKIEELIDYGWVKLKN